MPPISCIIVCCECEKIVGSLVAKLLLDHDYFVSIRQLLKSFIMAAVALDPKQVKLSGMLVVNEGVGVFEIGSVDSLLMSRLTHCMGNTVCVSG